MQAEALRPPGLELAVPLEELLAREAVLRLLGLADDGVALLERAGVVPAAHQLGNAGGVAQRADVRDVVEVDDRAGLARGDELGRRRVIGREHDVLAADARLLREEDLGKRTRVGAETLFGEDLEYVRVGQRLDCEEFLEAVAEDREGVDELSRVVSDGPLVVEVERRGVPDADRLEALLGEREGLIGHGSFSYLY